MTWQLYSFNC